MKSLQKYLTFLSKINFQRGLIFLLILLTLELNALLSPLNQSIVEIKEILESQELQNFVQQEAIKRIEKNQKGYGVYTENFQVQAEVFYLPIQHLGPHQFKLIFSISEIN